MERRKKIMANCKKNVKYCICCEDYCSCFNKFMARKYRRRRWLTQGQKTLLLCFLIIIINTVSGFTMLKSIATEIPQGPQIPQKVETMPVAETEETLPPIPEIIEGDEVSSEEKTKVITDTFETLLYEESQIKTNETKERVQLLAVQKTEEEVLPEPRISAEEAGEVYYYDVTEEEKMYIARVVYVEARGETLEGKVAVAAVILNRYMSDCSWFDRRSILHVITQPYQFADSYWVTQSHLDQIPECMEAVELALKGWDPTRQVFENGACFFYAPKDIDAAAASSRNGVETLIIGNHAFHNDFN